MYLLVNYNTSTMSVSRKKILITSALPYVNNVPHLGNIIGSVLSADVYARYARSFVCDSAVLFVGGVDEYGTATEMKAMELNKSCKELCDENSRLHKQIYDWFQISFDCYGRTSQPNGNPSVVQTDWPQTSITHQIYKDLCKNGYIIEQTEPVMYCPEKDQYVADRFVIGTCPNCRSNKADGDQCDVCGRLLTPNDIIDPRYKLNPDWKLEVRDTKNLYIDIDKIWKDNNLVEWVESRYPTWTKTASNITNEWLKIGFKPRSITRDLKWGTSVPYTPEFTDRYSSKVFYVWFDAPIGYISITESSTGQKESHRFWKDSSTKLIQFMAKDNVQFHSVIFPATLRGSGYSDITDLDIVSTEYLMYEGQKFSKSNNVGLFGNDVIEISKKYNILPDLWRAYLISIRPESADANFVLNGEGGFVTFVNNVLIKNIGNLLHRILSVSFQIRVKHAIDTIATDIVPDIDMITNINALVADYHQQMKQYKFVDAIRTVFKYSSRLNAYVNEVEPWTLIKQEDEKTRLYNFMATMYVLINELSDLLEPFMPSVSKKICIDFSFKNTSIENEDVLNKAIIFTLPSTKPTVMFKPLEDIVYDRKNI